MQPAAQRLFDIGEPFAAGFLEFPDGSAAKKFCRAYRRFFETCPLSYEPGAPLFPTGVVRDPEAAVFPNYFLQYEVDMPRLEKKSTIAAADFKAFMQLHPHSGGWSHGVLDYKRILQDGVSRYESRVQAIKDDDLRESLLDVLCGIRAYYARALSHLKEVHAPEALISAFSKVPYSPAETAYEALVSWNFMLSLDGWDNAGRLDAVLAPYHKGEDLTAVIHCMLKSMQDNWTWSVTLGPDYNDITYQTIRASKGIAKPMIQLRTVKDMPNGLWDLAVDRILQGGGQPSFYNEAVIQQRLERKFPNAPKEDLLAFTGAGCTETCFAGLTHAGGIDLNLNVLQIFESHLYSELETAESFDSFYSAFVEKVRDGQDCTLNEVNEYYTRRAKYLFAPIRTLFTEDCIDRELGHFQGGARYNYGIVSESGIPNTIDSLMAVKTLVFDEKRYTPTDFLAALKAGGAELQARLRACPCYGTENPEADALMQNFTDGFYAYYEKGKLDVGGLIIPTSHQFWRHISEGALVGNTPDGRTAHTPVADSIAAANGKALEGPTAMLRSAASFVQDRIYGIPVLNLSITRKYDPLHLRALVEGYFALGGTQMQITAVERETLLSAQKDPEAHRDLVVRVGGYSDFFHRLSKELQDAVVARTLFEV